MKQEGKNGALVIGASAGGLTGLRTILGSLPADFALPVLIVQHLSPDSPEPLLPEILSHACALPVKEARDKQPLGPGVFTAPAGYHLQVENKGMLSLSMDEPVHFSRPSIDVLFESAADVFGKELLGILLSGANEDGAAGLESIKQRGGLTIVQNPEEAEAKEMPLSAIKRFEVDLVGRLEEIAAFLSHKE